MADDASRIKWDNTYRDAAVGQAEACALLRDFAYLLPEAGSALDIASGLGGNALFMARRGWESLALDISPVAVQGLNDYARDHALQLSAQVVDFSVDDLPARTFDLIVVSHYLERRLAPQIIAALKPLGLLMYQTFTQETTDATGPRNLHFRLAPNELLRLFDGLHVVFYREEGRLGDVSRGLRNSAQLIAQRRV